MMTNFGTRPALRYGENRPDSSRTKINPYYPRAGLIPPILNRLPPLLRSELQIENIKNTSQVTEQQERAVNFQHADFFF
jgi:hypothetical protein